MLITLPDSTLIGPTNTQEMGPHHLFQCPFYFHALYPGNGGIGQAVAIIAPPGDVDLLLVQVTECLGHHLHGVVGQRRRVLCRRVGGRWGVEDRDHVRPKVTDSSLNYVTTLPEQIQNVSPEFCCQTLDTLSPPKPPISDQIWPLRDYQNPQAEIRIRLRPHTEFLINLHL